MKPKYHIGQQIVFHDGNDQHIGVIHGATGDADGWQYHLNVSDDPNTTTYVAEHSVVYYLKEAQWVSASGSHEPRLTFL